VHKAPYSRVDRPAPPAPTPESDADSPVARWEVDPSDTRPLLDVVADEAARQVAEWAEALRRANDEADARAASYADAAVVADLRGSALLAEWERQLHAYRYSVDEARRAGIEVAPDASIRP
jgi:hypothetical protein